MKLPKYTIAQTTPAHAWGCARLRTPFMLAEFTPVTEQPGLIDTVFQTTVWPLDIRDRTTPAKIERSLDQMWSVFVADADLHWADRVVGYHLAHEVPLPRYLVLDDDESDFTGVLDTRDRCLWIADDTLRGLELLDWQMAPDLPPIFTFPRSTREIAAFWEIWCDQQADLDDEEYDD